MSATPDGSIDQETADLILRLQLGDAARTTRDRLSALERQAHGDWQPDYPEPDEPESSAWAAGRKPEPGRLTRCVACQDDVNLLDIATLPCGHEYCRSCVTELFELSLTAESLFPPRCCRTSIDLDLARIFLTNELVQQYEKKRVEF
ncbi:hypothetical protein ASPCAL06975 [Aspergillus calidoustus]|uniref:RING-type domain-containing protein n=1 Tax=Aspergillus calidoustus TaxID=454130 RepID=A0A0U5G3S1_ASPCI|nr:hypothetical protein ASPCAL06975 [Aspergillus calidoustus]